LKLLTQWSQAFVEEKCKKKNVEKKKRKRESRCFYRLILPFFVKILKVLLDKCLLFFTNIGFWLNEGEDIFGKKEYCSRVQGAY